MAATTNNRPLAVRGAPIVPVFAVSLALNADIPLGVLVSCATPVNAGANNATDTAGTKVFGVSVARAVYANGDRFVLVAKFPGVLFANSGLTAADVGGLAYVIDNQTVGTAAAAVNDIKAGRILEVTSEGVWLLQDGTELD